MEPRKPALGIALWGTHPMPKLVEQVRIAEALGFESVWVIDSQLICRDIFVTWPPAWPRRRAWPWRPVSRSRARGT
jgi:alkanesulfonate monooxygenase SsuD/methylene tetrahydromethanopterin reductase-like flavin-dependent oxidoreductase (luciferase family)